MTRPIPRGTLAFGGMAAGLIVGMGDGLWAALLAGADWRATLSAQLLAASVDALIGGVGGALVEVFVRFAAWGRRVRVARSANVAAALLLGACVAVASIAVAASTVERRNRFLAGGAVASAALGFGVAGAALLPSLARLLGRRRNAPVALQPPDPSLLLLGPLALIVVGVVVMLAAVEIHRPVGRARVLHHFVLLGVEAGLLPALLALAEKLRLRMKLARSAPLAAVIFGIPLVMFVTNNWSTHLRFIPWTHVLPALVMAAVALANVSFAAPLLDIRPARRGALAAALAALLVTLLLASAESEPARKITATHTAFVGPVLAGARQLLDRDHDGYSRILGGGDCNDGDPTIHPGILDFPDDGIDQDCDGRDASAAVLKPPPFSPVPDQVPPNLNLLLITVDTVRADHLGCYGYSRPTSPEIDRLAHEGALFVNGWAHAPSTRYSMPAIATGRWPTAIAWDESIWWPRIAPTVRTIAEALKAAGYFTAAFYSYEYFSPADRRGFERGVDLYRADRAALHRAVNGPMESHGSSSKEMADDTIAFLEAHKDKDKEKFFLWVHFYDPHLSYEPHSEVPSFGTNRVDLYDGEIRFTDLHVGRVLERLRALGLWDHTVVVLTGDHGEGFGEHGITEHGFDLYAPQTKVPLLVRVPGLAARRTAVPAGHVDLAPTLLNLARAPQDKSFLGRSLVAELAGLPSGAAAPPVFQEVTSERGKKRALATADFHLIWNWTPENTTECYDLRADPGERRDLWGRREESTCRSLKEELQGMVSALSVPADLADKLKASVFGPAAAAPVPDVSVDARIGDVVRIAGYSLRPAVPAAGGEVDVSILFQSLRTVTGGWRFFFHLFGPGGSFRNLDHVPVDGAMPPDRWRPGQRIVDHLRVSFPPGTRPGEYRLVMGLFRGGERLPVSPESLTDGRKALRLATIKVP